MMKQPIVGRGYQDFEARCRAGEIAVGSEVSVGGYNYTLAQTGEEYKLDDRHGSNWPLFSLLRHDGKWSVLQAKAPHVEVPHLGEHDRLVRLSTKGGMYFADIGVGHVYSGDLPTIAENISKGAFPADGTVHVIPGIARVRGKGGSKSMKGADPADADDAESLQASIQAARSAQSERVRQTAEEARGKTRTPPPGVRVTYHRGSWY